MSNLHAGHDLEMIKVAVEVQEYYAANQRILRPSFVYDYDLDRVCINLWLPKKLREKIRQVSEFDSISVSIEEYRESGVVIEEKKGEVIWLPTQAQLWKIIPETVKHIEIERNVKFEEGMGLRIYAKIPVSAGITDHWNMGGFSVEQLLLKLLYRAKFNKTWDGKNWIVKVVNE